MFLYYIKTIKNFFIGAKNFKIKKKTFKIELESLLKYLKKIRLFELIVFSTKDISSIFLYHHRSKNQ